MEELTAPVGGMILPEEERAEYTEFKRSRREAEAHLTVKKLIADASGRDTDRAALKKICDFTKRMKLGGILLSPVNVPLARRMLSGSGIAILCVVGGTGETLPAVKKFEARRAVRAGAAELFLIPSLPALAGGNFGALRREIARVRRAAKGRAVRLLLDDRAYGAEEIALGVRAAKAGRIAGVCVRGEEALMRAADAGAVVDCGGVENSEQLKGLLALGASRFVTPCPERLSEEILSVRDA